MNPYRAVACVCGGIRDKRAKRCVSCYDQERHERAAGLLDRLPEILAQNTRPEGDCIVWTSPTRNRKGYGFVSAAGLGRRFAYVHRLVWMRAHGPIPDGLVVRHQCDNPPCVNLEHLAIGTTADNARDAVERGRNYRPPRATACIRGHELTESPSGKRRCKTCDAARQRAYKSKPEARARRRAWRHLPEVRARETAAKRRWRERAAWR